VPEPVRLSEALDEVLAGLLSYQGPIRRVLQHQSSAAHCHACDKTIVSVAAVSWAVEHCEATGHSIDVDYASRHRVYKPRKAL
jgi:hypothetical protein